MINYQQNCLQKVGNGNEGIGPVALSLTPTWAKNTRAGRSPSHHAPKYK
jgi:hypothetical protein